VNVTNASKLASFAVVFYPPFLIENEDEIRR